jgi:hypothetical protein
MFLNQAIQYSDRVSALKCNVFMETCKISVLFHPIFFHASCLLIFTLATPHTQAADAQSTYCFATRAAALTNAWYAVQDVLLVPVALVALLPPFTVRAIAHFAVAVDADADAVAPDSFYCEPLRAAVVFQVCKCRRCEGQ